MVFERGKTVQKMKEIGTSKSNGTTITFWPDDMIFETTTYNFDTLRDRLQETAFLNKNLKITLVDERELTPRQVDFQYAGGIIDFVKYLNGEKNRRTPVRSRLAPRANRAASGSPARDPGSHRPPGEKPGLLPAFPHKKPGIHTKWIPG